jgi:hypothetical protein
MIKPMARAFILTPMVQTIMESGRMINSMDLVWRDGLMVLSMKVTIVRVKKMDLVS